MTMIKILHLANEDVDIEKPENSNRRIRLNEVRIRLWRLE